MLDLRAPFVLLDDAATGVATLYRDPVEVFAAATLDEVGGVLDAVRTGTRAGRHAAGFVAYEATPAFEPRLAARTGAGTPLAWFGLFERAEPVDPLAMLPDPAGAWNGPAVPTIDEATYAAQFARVLALIAAGDIYQANLTFAATVPFAGDPLSLYARLRSAARAPYGAVVATGEHTILSFSPELFFALEGRRVTARPMKGTATRGTDPADDAARAAGLSEDAKQRAENLMIVDLLRNDLSRVATPGSVAVPRLFAVETYPTLHQMVSDVTAELTPRHDAIDVIGALLPCGSITGAPKIRASEVIAEIEARGRGVYTGAIGQIGPSGDATFNVAIRTLVIAGDERHATMGLGSGIVADSRAGEEWAECLAKAAFVGIAPRFDLIETMAFDPEAGIARLETHLARMKASAATFGFAFDRHAARNELQAATFRLRRPRRIRLLLSAGGAIAIETGPLPPAPDAPVPVALRSLPVGARDVRLAHKTTDRGFYDTARQASGAFEVAFVDHEGFLTEGSFTSLFVRRGGRLVTSPLSRGLLPGVLRADLIASGEAIEGDLTPADLAGGFFIGNALRGLMPAIVADANGIDL